jgi:L-lysine 2,3-aminomutase
MGMVNYLKKHPEVTDVLITGGDAFTMSAAILEKIVDALLSEYLPSIRTIRFGSRVLSYWPYRFLSDKDSQDVLELFKKIRKAGIHVAFMAAFLHPNELKTNAVKLAIEKILETGAQIRTQAPILKNVNNCAEKWAELWKEQVNLGCVPYYMFIPRNTGAQHYFAVPLVEAWKTYQSAYQNISGICRTVRGPIMSTDPGKVQILGPTVIQSEKLITMQFLQARDPDWVLLPFFADYTEKAIWLDELKPAFGEDRFFFEGQR